MIARVLDVETSLNNVGEGAVGDFAANPHHPDNWIVWLGMGDVDTRRPLRTRNQTNTRFKSAKHVAIPAPGPGTLLIGHNIKYDLEMLAHPHNQYAEQWYSWILDPRSKIWDTMVAEYRLRGQNVINPSLDFCTSERGWPTKPGRLKEYWNKGISTENIPDEEVDPYLLHDINSTGRLFLDQLRLAQDYGMIPLLQEEMGATLALTSAEINGMHFQKKAAMDQFEGEMAEEIEEAATRANATLQLAGVPHLAISLGSNPMLSTLVYGGEYKYEYRLPLLDDDGNQVYFKSGKKKGMPRDKIHKVVWTNTPMTHAKTSSVDEDALKKIAKHSSTDKAVGQAIDAVLIWRKLKKQATTYFIGYSKLTWDHDNKIHGSLNQTIANTARLSSSSPNLQNADHGPIRTHFTSRKEGGRLMEIDLSQIEIVVRGIQSQDTHMLKDLHAGIDFHSKYAAIAAAVEYEVVRAGYLTKDPHWTHKRKNSKSFSFERAYGAGPASIASNNDIPYKEVMDLIAGEEKEYPGLKVMTDEWIAKVAKSATRIGDDVLGLLISQTGSRYVFKREIYKGKASFRPTMIKNYPVQGLAGDIIKIILNRIRKVLYAWSNLHEIYFVNTVHDSLIFDITDIGDEMARSFAREIHEVMTSETEQVLREKFGLDFEGLIKADVDVGHNWYEFDEESNPLGMTGFEI